MLILTTFDLDEYVYEACVLEQAVSCSKTSPRRAFDAVRVIASGEALLAWANSACETAHKRWWPRTSPAWSFRVPYRPGCAPPSTGIIAPVT